MASGSEGTVERLDSWNAVAVYVVIRYFTDRLTRLVQQICGLSESVVGRCEALTDERTRDMFQAVSVGVDAAELFEPAMRMFTKTGGKQSHRNGPANRFVEWAS